MLPGLARYRTVDRREAQSALLREPLVGRVTARITAPEFEDVFGRQLRCDDTLAAPIWRIDLPSGAPALPRFSVISRSVINSQMTDVHARRRVARVEDTLAGLDRDSCEFKHGVRRENLRVAGRAREDPSIALAIDIAGPQMAGVTIVNDLDSHPHPVAQRTTDLSAMVMAEHEPAVSRYFATPARARLSVTLLRHRDHPSVSCPGRLQPCRGILLSEVYQILAARCRAGLRNPPLQ